MRSSLARAGLLLGAAFCLLFLLKSSAASFVPDVDRIILVTGQNVESVTNYVATLGGIPGGIMSYTSTAGAEGLTTTASYGSGNIFAQYFVADPGYSNTVVQMGLYINNDLVNIAAGLRDANLLAIGNWIKSAGRPVYLRIGYEFDGPWNALPPAQYIAAYRHIVDNLRGQGVTNAAYVWHSACVPPFGGFSITAWYPGDDYVDWAGVSIFQQFAGTLGTVVDIDNFCAFAKSRNKPIMIAESTPYGGISDARWANWFVPCLELIHRHHIQMWCYINTAWDSLPLFAGQGWGDSRIQMNALVQSNWQAMISDPAFLKESPQLYPRLHASATNYQCEAEAAALNGASLYVDPAASGGVAVTGLNAPGRAVEFTNAGPAQQLVLRYATANFGTIGLYVNAQPRRTLPLAPTGATSGVGAYRDLLVHAAIPAGATVKLQFDAGDAPVNVDSILFRGYADTYGTGLPDDWQMWRFGSLNHAGTDDPDGDGSPNYDEFVADTDPMDRTSNLRLGNLSVNEGVASLAMTLPGSRDCYLQQSSDLKNWTFLPVMVRTNPTAPVVVASNLPSDKLFLRLLVP